MNIVKLAQSVSSLSTLVTAVFAANLTGVLSSPGPFTVFAPNNDAFNQIPPATINSLLDPANILELIEILELHVVSGTVYQAALRNKMTIKTVSGGELTVTCEWDTDNVCLGPLQPPGGVKYPIYIGSGTFRKPTVQSEIIAADNEATNGVVHIVRSVLLPPP